jgi:4-amino-4-deoxy-L-arabinose transferase-like glycosyltransferase
VNDVQRFRFRGLPERQRLALTIGMLSTLWMVCIIAFGGINTSVFGIKLRSTEWFDAAIVAGISFWVFARQRRRTSGRPVLSFRDAVGAAFQRCRTPEGLLVIAILAVAAIVRLWGLSFGLPHPAVRPDEDAIGSIAGSFLSGNPEPPIFNYPPLFTMTVAATIWLVFTKLPPMLGRIGIHPILPDPGMAGERMLARLLSAAAGVTSVWLLFRIAARLFGRPTAYLGAAFLALAFLHVRDSHFGVTDIPMTFMVLVGFLAIVRLSESGSRRDLIAAGVLTGLGVATKYNAVLLVLPAAFAILDDPLHRPVRDRIGRVVAFVVLMAAAFLIVCPYALLSHERFVADVMFESRHLAEGAGADLGRGWLYHVTTTLRYGLGAPLFAAGLLGLPLMVWREGRRGVLVALFPLAYYLLVGSGRTVFARYILPAVPFLCLTAAYAVAAAAAWFTGALHRPRWLIPITMAMASVVISPSILSVVAFDRLLAREDTRVIARRWIEERFAPGATVAQVGPSNGHVYVDYENRYVLSNAISAERPTLVIIVSSPLPGSPNLARLAPLLDREYDLQFAQMVAGEDDGANTYDRQDEFYLPLAGFHRVERPGPNLRIYVRRDARINPAPMPMPDH